jgi:hypothetical protein
MLEIIMFLPIIVVGLVIFITSIRNNCPGESLKLWGLNPTAVTSIQKLKSIFNWKKNKECINLRRKIFNLFKNNISEELYFPQIHTMTIHICISFGNRTQDLKTLHPCGIRTRDLQGAEAKMALFDSNHLTKPSNICEQNSRNLIK